MSKNSSHLKWCIVYPAEDQCWWVKETSDPIHWDVDGLSILDPKQVGHILDLMDPLRDYKLQPELFDLAFYPFAIKQELPNNCVRLEPSFDNLAHSDDILFGLPDVLDEEKSPYADFLAHITKLRVKLLNDLIDFKQPLTIEDVEEELRERQNNDFMEGRRTHIFNEICDILEYVPHGYELDLNEPEKEPEEAEVVTAEDLPEVEEDEDLEQDETMKWDEDEDQDQEDEDDLHNPPEEDEDQEDEDLDYKPQKTHKKTTCTPSKPKGKKKA